MIKHLLTTEKNGDKRFHRTGPNPRAILEVEKGLPAIDQTHSFEVAFEYKVKLELYSRFTATYTELGRKTENSRKILQDTIYGKAIHGLREIMAVSEEPEIQIMVSDLINRMINE